MCFRTIKKQARRYILETDAVRILDFSMRQTRFQVGLVRPILKFFGNEHGLNLLEEKFQKQNVERFEKRLERARK